MAEYLERGVLESECDQLERSVRFERLASEAEIDTQRPGSEKNPDKTIYGQLRYYGWLSRLHARGTHKQSEMAREKADALILAAYEEKPEPVQLVRPVDGRTEVLVYPKSFSALLDAGVCDRRIAQCTAIRDVMLRQPKPGDRAYAEQAERAYRHFSRTFIWIATHPGAGVPYDWDAPDPAPPEWTALLDSRDVIGIIQAFIAVNLLAMKALDILTHPDPITDGGVRPTWSEWFAGMAKEMNTDPKHLMRNRSFVGLLAAQGVAAETQRKAMRKADSARGN